MVAHQFLSLSHNDANTLKTDAGFPEIYLPTHQNTQPHTLQNISLKRSYPPKYHKLKKNNLQAPTW